METLAQLLRLLRQLARQRPAHPGAAPARPQPACRRRRSPAPRTARSAPRPAGRRAWKIESCESFQPCCTRPSSLRRAYSTKPSPSASPHSSIHCSACEDVGPDAADQCEVAGAPAVGAPPAPRTAASSRPNRSSARTGSRASTPSRCAAPHAGSCRARHRFAGPAPSPVSAARKVSTPRASDGSTHRYSSAVMMPSRPKVVENHGTPANG